MGVVGFGGLGHMATKISVAMGNQVPDPADRNPVPSYAVAQAQPETLNLHSKPY